MRSMALAGLSTANGYLGSDKNAGDLTWDRFSDFPGDRVGTHMNDPIPDSLAQRLVAHRGYPSAITENTVDSLKAAMELGARWIEFDVRLSADARPVLYHDDTLARLAGQSTPLSELTLAQLEQQWINDPDSADRAVHRIASLDDTIRLLDRFPEIQALVEIKPEPVRELGVRAVLDAIMPSLNPIRSRCVVISYSTDLLAQLDPSIRKGWIVPAWTAENATTAAKLSPQLLIINHSKVPPGATLWPGPWHWAAYVADRPEVVRDLVSKGFELVETNDIGALLAELDPHE
jgi:glycerophosphoryl diester phosphodiesterase